MYPVILLLLLCVRGALGVASDGASPYYSSIIRTISRSKVLWQWSQGTCHSAMLINMSSSEPLWQQLPLGSSESQVCAGQRGYGTGSGSAPRVLRRLTHTQICALHEWISSFTQDFSQALIWGSNLFYTLRQKPALTALSTRHGTEAFQWPRRRSPLLFRWLWPLALDLPGGSRLVGPTPMGDRVILHSQGEAKGASSHLYAVFAANGTLAWQADVTAVAPEGPPGQVPRLLDEMIITDVLFNFPGLMVAASTHPLQPGSGGNGTWGMAAEWRANGTLRWASDALVPAPIRVAGSTELMAIAVSATDIDGDTAIFGLSRESGAPCRGRVLGCFYLSIV